MTAPAAPLFCANHPTVETSLRCNLCAKPICVKCAVHTPTGYRCRECVRSHHKKFDTAVWSDYLLGFLVGAVLSTLVSLLVTLIAGIAGFFAWIVIIVASPTAGVAIAEALRFVTRKHRSKPLFMTLLASVIVGALPAALYQLLTFNFWNLIFLGVYLFIAIPVLYYRLTGIRLTK